MRLILLLSGYIFGLLCGWMFCRMAWLRDKRNDMIIFNEKLRRLGV